VNSERAPALFLAKRFTWIRLSRRRSAARRVVETEWEAGRYARISVEVIMLGTILIVLLILFLVGALPTWGHSRNWGYGPSGLLGVVVIVVLILLLMGRI
jgi:hypothetical protein